MSRNESRKRHSGREHGAGIAVRSVGAVLAIALVAGLAAGAPAADYPAGPVKVIVPFSAGSATDTIARAVGAKLGELWGQPVTFENVVGAGGTAGADAVAKAPPDGRTILFTSNAFTANTALHAKLPFDATKDFAAIAPLTRQPYVLMVAPASAFKTVADLVAAAKTTPGQLKFGSAGIGSGTHFAAEKFRIAAGIDVGHVPYKGGPEATAGTVSGEVAFWFPPLALAQKAVKEGKLAALAVTGAKRAASLPDVPTVAEAGVAGFEDTSWMGVWIPSAVPAAVSERLAKDIARALAVPELRDQLVALGAEPMSMTSAEFATFVRGEMDSAARVVKAAGIKQQ